VLRWYADFYTENNTQEANFLYLLSLFDRPMGLAEKDELVKHAECAAPLRTLNDLAWQPLEKTLENAGLLLHSEGMRTQWDCHPLIRSYFGQQFKETRPAQFRQAHRVLFEYYQKVPQKQQPDTLEELEPLYRAVVHGCLAEKYYEVDVIYWERILRKNAYYSQNKLGAYSQDLIILEKFFNQDWSPREFSGQKLQNVKPEQWLDIQAWLFGIASYCLTSLGRLKEAVRPRELNVMLAIKASEDGRDDNYKKKKWQSASKASRNLSDLQLLLGKIKEAIQTAQKTLEFAEASDNISERVKSHSRYAWIAYMQGDVLKSTECFQKAERIQQESEPNTPLLPLFSGFLYCSFLLDQADEQSKYEHILYRKVYVSKDERLLHIALEHLIIAKVHHKQGGTETDHFDEAVDKIRVAGTIQYLPMFLIDRANFYLDQQQVDKALRDLTEAWQIIKRSDMKLYAVDYHLAMRRYARVKQPEQVQFHENEAKRLIEATGYHLRKV